MKDLYNKLEQLLNQNFENATFSELLNPEKKHLLRQN